MSNELSIVEASVPETKTEVEPKWQFTANDFDDNPPVPEKLADSSAMVILSRLDETPPPEPKLGPARKALAHSPFDFQVGLAPLGIDAPNADDFRACIRMDTRHIFGIVSPNYGFCQPRDLAKLVDAAIPENARESTVVNVGGTHSGERLWFSTRIRELLLSEKIKAAGTAIRADSPIFADLLFSHAYGGKGTYNALLAFTIQVCGNGMCMPLPGYQKEVKLRHTASFKERVEVLQGVFAKAAEASEHYWAVFGSLASKSVGSQELVALSEKLFPGESTRAKHKREDLARAYVLAPGAAPGTAWGLLQASTYYSTHLADVRVGGRSAKGYRLDIPQDQVQAQARLEGIIQGQGADLNQTAFAYVTSLLD